MKLDVEHNHELSGVYESGTVINCPGHLIISGSIGNNCTINAGSIDVSGCVGDHCIVKGNLNISGRVGLHCVVNGDLHLTDSGSIGSGVVCHGIRTTTISSAPLLVRCPTSAYVFGKNFSSLFGGASSAVSEGPFFNGGSFFASTGGSGHHHSANPSQSAPVASQNTKKIWSLLRALGVSATDPRPSVLNKKYLEKICKKRFLDVHPDKNIDKDEDHLTRLFTEATAAKKRLVKYIGQTIPNCPSDYIAPEFPEDVGQRVAYS